jgi:hypothetical protein
MNEKNNMQIDNELRECDLGNKENDISCHTLVVGGGIWIYGYTGAINDMFTYTDLQKYQDIYRSISRCDNIPHTDMWRH